MRTRSLLLVCAVTAAAAACSGGGGGPPAAVSPGRWVVAQASFDPPVKPYPPTGPQIQQVIVVPGGWAALGSLDGRGLASWRSGDGVHWRLTQQVAATPANAFVGIRAVVRHDADLVAAGASGKGAAVWVSHDEGGSWTRVTSKALVAGSTIAAAVVVRGAVVMVGGIDAANNDAAAWIMRDDAHIDAVAVPGTGPTPS